MSIEVSLKYRFMKSHQHEKAARFRALHDAPGVFIIPNPWDAGSAKILEGLGFSAFATSSGAAACTLGRRDGRLTRDEALAHAYLIVEATDLPVSADLENGFGDAPEAVAETIRRAAEAGLVGCTIEDSTGNPDHPLYEDGLAVDRIAAGAEAARALGFPFILAARAHNLMYPNGNLDETIRRLQAFEKAGADVLFAPGLPKGKSFTVSELAATGVKRISLAGSLYRAAMSGFLDAIRQMKHTGRFDFLDYSVTTPELYKLMGI
jgi:2-methylisocitrate lyase-like PEP mutase family enzyme